MPSWSDFAAVAPELAATVRTRLNGHPYKLIATLRKDGSPRISGIEVEFLENGELRAGSMPDSVKVHDLDRDGRFCLHNAPAPQADWTGDAKLTGIAHPTTAPREEARYYRLDLREVATIGVGGSGLAIEVWTPEGPELGTMTGSRPLSPRLQAIVDALPLQPDSRVLEIGCGPGAAARAIAARLHTGNVLAIDRSAAAVAQAKATGADEIATGRLDIRQVAAENLVLQPDEQPYDLVLAVRVGALDGRHPKDAERVLQRIALATTPEARLFIDGGNPLRELSIPWS